MSSAQQTLLGLKEQFEEKAVYFCCCCCLLPFIIFNLLSLFLLYFILFFCCCCSLFSSHTQGWFVPEALSRRLWHRQSPTVRGWLHQPRPLGGSVTSACREMLPEAAPCSQKHLRSAPVLLQALKFRGGWIMPWLLSHHQGFTRENESGSRAWRGGGMRNFPWGCLSTGKEKLGDRTASAQPGLPKLPPAPGETSVTTDRCLNGI